MGLILPITLPTSLTNKKNVTITLPITLPLSFTEKGKISLPITLPLRFIRSSEKRNTTVILYREHINLSEFYGSDILPYRETAFGKTVKIPYKETAWFFPGLILSENVITTVSQQLNIVENVQALILVDFELMSTNSLKLSWYGNTVPSFTIMKKSAVDENYTPDKTYNWDEKEAIVNIESEDYNLYLQGSSNSGTSAIYNIGGTSNVLIEPEVEVSLNDKIYTIEIDYVTKYYLEINY